MNEEKIIEVNGLVRAKSRNELISMCKERSLPVSGTKHDMAVRLIGGWADEDTCTSIRLQPSIKPIIIKRNCNGQWEFDGIIFDDNTRNAIGYLTDNGSVQPLQRDHIDICKKYKFKYILPCSLDDRSDHNDRQAVVDSSDSESETDSDNEDENNS